MFRFGRCALPACVITLALVCMPVRALAADGQTVQETVSSTKTAEAVVASATETASSTAAETQSTAGTQLSSAAAEEEKSSKSDSASEAAASKTEAADDTAAASSAKAQNSSDKAETSDEADAAKCSSSESTAASDKKDTEGTGNSASAAADGSKAASAAESSEAGASTEGEKASSESAASAKEGSTSSAEDTVAAAAASTEKTAEAKSAETATAASAAGYDTTGKVPLYRLYNKWSGEHFFTVNTYEATNLIAIGWSGESVSWFSPTYSTVKVYRLYNQWSGDHYYTANTDERKSLIKIGWTNEGVGWFSDTNKALPVYTLFNPYAKIATHHYTTQVSERNHLVSLGWIYTKSAGPSWYGTAVPANGWFTSPAGDRLLISVGKVQTDEIVYDNGKKCYITTAGFEATTKSTWYSPSNKRYYRVSDGGDIQLAPQTGYSYCWLKNSPYWSGTVKEVHMNKNYMEGRYYDGVQHYIKKIVIHHNAGSLTTEGCWNTWQTREASAHYQVETNGTVGQLVYDSDTAWQAGNWNTNLESIGIEHADAPGSSDRNGWRLTEATINAGSKLVAVLCIVYQLGRPQWGVNVVGHNECSSTSCPASLAVGGSQHNEYISKAQSWYDKLITLKI